jgi:hypothetical protein
VRLEAGAPIFYNRESGESILLKQRSIFLQWRYGSSKCPIHPVQILSDPDSPDSRLKKLKAPGFESDGHRSTTMPSHCFIY